MNETIPRKLTTYDKERIDYLIVNHMLYARIPSEPDNVFRPSAVKFHRDGTVSAYEPFRHEAAYKCWVKMTGGTFWSHRDENTWRF